MKTWNLLALAVGALATGACGTTVYVGGSVPVGAPVHTIKAGAGTVVDPGTQAGYGITANTGGSYRIFWTGDSQASGTYREFQGSIYTSGTFISENPGCGGICALEAGDYVSQPILTGGGERIDFDTFATDGLDGTDFVVSTEPVYFDLLIDGVRYPQLVFYTDAILNTSASPADIPFGLTM